MKLNPSTVTAGVVLVAAIIGGASGAALVLSDDGAPSDTPRPVEMGVATSEEASPAPAASPSASPITEPSPSSVTAPAAPEKEPSVVTEPSPTPAPAPDNPPAEAPAPTPATAEPAVPAATPAPTPTPKPTPVPECVEGTKQGIPYPGNSIEDGGVPGERTCIAGKWVITKEPSRSPAATPEPPVSQ